VHPAFSLFCMNQLWPRIVLLRFASPTSIQKKFSSVAGAPAAEYGCDKAVQSNINCTADPGILLYGGEAAIWDEQMGTKQQPQACPLQPS
jgi:hypothetical protein